MDPTTIGRRVRRIRHARGKSLEVVAGLAGMSAAFLSWLETGERSLDRLSLIVTLANALEVAPSELTRLPVPAPANGDTDARIAAVSSAITAVNHDLPGGQVLPVEALRERAVAVLDDNGKQDNRVRDLGAVLPRLICDLHTSINAPAMRSRSTIRGPATASTITCSRTTRTCEEVAGADWGVTVSRENTAVPG